MTRVASRDLRNHTADVLRQAASGAPVTITVNGEPVAQLTALDRARPRFFSRATLLRLLSTAQADPGLAADLERLAGETTDDLGDLPRR